MTTSNPAVGLSCLIYRFLLRAYPRTFRKRFECEMRQTFRDLCMAKYRNQGLYGLFGVWWATLIDLIKTVPLERWTAMDRWALVWLVVGISDGLFASYVDFHNDEVQATVLVILICSFVLGMIRPKGAWRWALAVGLGVPLCHLCGKWFGLVSPYPVKPNDFASLIALIPAFIGSYIGALMRISINLAGDPPRSPGARS